MIAPLNKEVVAFLEPVGDHELMRAQLLGRAGDLLALATSGPATEVIFSVGSMPLFGSFINLVRRCTPTYRKAKTRISFITPQVSRYGTVLAELSRPYKLDASYVARQQNLFGDDRYIMADLTPPDEPNLEFVSSSLLSQSLVNDRSAIRSFSVFSNGQNPREGAIEGAFSLPQAEIFCGLGRDSDIRDAAFRATERLALPFKLRNPEKETETRAILANLKGTAAAYESTLRTHSLIPYILQPALSSCLAVLMERKTPKSMFRAFELLHSALLGNRNFVFLNSNGDAPVVRQPILVT